MITTLLLGINVLAALPTNGTKEFTGSMANGSPTLSSFIDGFTFINTSGFNLSADGATGIYLANTGSSATVTVSADGTNLETFDLTATTFRNFNSQKSYSFTITGIKSDNSEVTTTFTTTTAIISDGNYTAFTGLKSFKISYSDNIIENITLDDFTIANATPPSSGPAITNTTYDASTGSLVVTGTDFEAKSGASNDVTANKFTFTGEGGSTYTLTDTPDVEITSSTEFTLVLSATDKTAVNQILNKNGTSSTSGTTYNISAADDYMANVTSDDTSSATNALTVSSIPTPAITSATYDATTGSLILTGTNFVKKSGATNDIDLTKLTLLGQDNNSYTLTSASVEITNSTSATISLNATDKLTVNGILNKDGISSVSGTTYNLSGAEDWMAGYTGTDADTSNNTITVSNVSTPTITLATYDATTGVLSVTGTNLVKKSGATNDIAVSSLTLKGEGSATRTLTTSDVEITSATSFSITLNSADKSAVNLILNNNGTSSTDSTTYNLSASDDWNSVIGNTDISDTSNGITVSNISNPTITSSTYDATTGTLVVTGTNFVSNAGTTNDIDITKLSVVGDASASYTLTTSNVEVTNDTAFTITLNATDKLNINGLLNKNGTNSGDSTTYNLSASDDWMQGALASNDISDTTGNGITVSNVPTSTITSATYDVTTGVLVVTGTNFVKKVGATNDVDVTKLTLKGQGSGTRVLTTTNIEVSSSTSFSVTLNSGDKTAVNTLLNKDGLSSIDSVIYNLAAAEDWMSGVDSSSNIADLTGNAITVSNADNIPPTISSISIPNSSMKIGDAVTATITVTSDSDDYTTGSGGITGTIGGFALTSLSKTNNTTYTAIFTVTSGGTDIASGSNIPVSFTLKDSAGNTSTSYTTAISQSADTIDANKPVLSNVSISSNNTSSSKAKVGDVITLTFTSNEALSSNPTVKIAGQNASVINTSANNYTATYTMQNSDTEGVIPFTIDFSD
ncbi:beta strand repeat-containing protein, partial [Poseidonibacter sp.]|uniref:beta strand repeat-containing protein n=1 Tax=Poseidonibacter sp. TaxID=2321188 RepID=UPI003C7064F6